MEAEFNRREKISCPRSSAVCSARRRSGFTPADFLSALDSDEYHHAVLTEQAQAVQLSVTGVPRW
jgi:predicted DsbA family dithiol-disulfide isomerase